MERVIVGYDDSPAARGALTWAVRFAMLPRAYDLALVLTATLQAWGEGLHVYDSITWFDNVVHFTLPFFGGIPFADADLGLDELDPGATDEEAVQEWLAGGGTDLLERFADPAMLLGMLGPWLAVGQLLALIVPIAVSIFTWWWMAHAMRPAGDAPDPSATDADAAAASSASAA